MPDTSASRKRQIQITPRTFRGTGASRAFLTDGRYPVSRVWAHVSKLCGLGGTWTARQSARAGAVRALSLRGVSAAWLPHALSKSREIDSIAPAARFDTAQTTVPDRSARAQAFATLYKCLPVPRKIGLLSFFAGFCPGWASVDGKTPLTARAPRAMTLTCVSIIGAKLPAADSASSLSIRCEKGRDGGYQPLAAAPTTAIGSQPELLENTK
jgi:hypothetical protein